MTAFLIHTFRGLIAAGIVVLAGCAKKPDPAAVTRSFFEQIAAGKSSVAYESSALQLKSQQSAPMFEQTARQLGLANYVTLETEAPTFENGGAKVTAHMTDRSGAKFVVYVTLVEERGAWRVYSLRTPKSAQTGVSSTLFSGVGRGLGFTDSVNQPRPTDAEIVKMVEDTLLLFNACVEAASFDDFYEASARKWQKELTKGQLMRTFQPFIDKRINIAGIRGLRPVFDPAPVINTEGMLSVSGSYPTKPIVVNFSLLYHYELPSWKVYGIDLKLTTAPTGEPKP